MKVPQIACTLCHSTFDISRPRALGGHMYSHSNEKPFECPDCADLFQNLQDYLKHMQSVHGESMYDCLVKDESDSSSAEQDNSMQNMTVEYSSDCSKSSNHHRNEDKSIYNDTAKVLETPKCVECGKDLDPSESDGNKRKQRTCIECRNLSIELTSEKTYKCEICDKDYPTLLSLRLHRRIHSGWYSTYYIKSNVYLI